MRSSLRFVVLSSCVLTAAVAVSAQAPPAGQAPAAPAAGAPPQGGRGGAQAPMQNIKVLPKNWSRQQVGAVMQTFTESLGVQCIHCHEPNPTAPPPQPGQNPQLDYALEGKPEKEVARNMISMVAKLNTDLAALGDKTKMEKVSCFTCHAGQKTPAFTPAAGWGRGSFTLSEAGPVTGRRGGGAPAGAPAGGAPAPGGAPAAPAPPAGR